MSLPNSYTQHTNLYCENGIAYSSSLFYQHQIFLFFFPHSLSERGLARKSLPHSDKAVSLHSNCLLSSMFQWYLAHCFSIQKQGMRTNTQTKACQTLREAEQHALDRRRSWQMLIFM